MDERNNNDERERQTIDEELHRLTQERNELSQRLQALTESDQSSPEYAQILQRKQQIKDRLRHLRRKLDPSRQARHLEQTRERQQRQRERYREAMQLVAVKNNNRGVGNGMVCTHNTKMDRNGERKLKRSRNRQGITTKSARPSTGVIAAWHCHYDSFSFQCNSFGSILTHFFTSTLYWQRANNSAGGNQLAVRRRVVFAAMRTADSS